MELKIILNIGLSKTHGGLIGERRDISELRIKKDMEFVGLIYIQFIQLHETIINNRI